MRPDSPDPVSPASAPRRPWPRWILFRAFAVFLGLSPLLLSEITLRMLDWGEPNRHEDPFLGFSAVYPLFVLDETGTRYEISPSRRTFFCPESFAAVKPPEEFRIFCLGGSTVQGRPFTTETSFTTWLELSLEAADTTRTWEVVNCGGVSYASYRLVPILEEVLGYEPDLVIIYTGHNEFLEDRSYGHIRDRPAVVTRILEAASRLRTFVVLRHGVIRLTSAQTAPAEGKPVVPAEVDAVLDQGEGLEFFRRDPKWRRALRVEPASVLRAE